MAESKWKTGDVVRLESGGWPMTVTGYHDARVGIVECVWFERREYISCTALASGTDKPIVTWDGPKRDTFHQDTLVLAQ